MKRFAALSTFGLSLLLAGSAWASSASTSADVTQQRGGGRTATATAEAQGRIEIARTRTRSGPVSLARGLAVGIDRDGLTLSVSNALAGQRGPALATNFNLSIGRDGRVSHSHGVGLSTGRHERAARAAGGISQGRYRDMLYTEADARSDRFGRALARTHNQSHTPPVRSRYVRDRDGERRQPVKRAVRSVLRKLFD